MCVCDVYIHCCVSDTGTATGEGGMGRGEGGMGRGEEGMGRGEEGMGRGEGGMGRGEEGMIEEGEDMALEDGMKGEVLDLLQVLLYSLQFRPEYRQGDRRRGDYPDGGYARRRPNEW